MLAKRHNYSMKQFFIILSIVFLIQLPNWFFLLGQDSGQINDFGNENWIIISDLMNLIFSFPIYFFVKDYVSSNLLAFLIYLVDLMLISLLVHLVINLIRKRAIKKL